MTRVTPLLFVLLVAVPAGAADDKPDTKRGDEMIDKYLANLTKEVSGRFLDGAKTRDDWEKKLPRLRREYLDMLGLWPLPEKTPLHATVTATLEHEGAVGDRHGAAAGQGAEQVAARAAARHRASWKMTPRVTRSPERTRLTPWRMVTR